MGGTPVSESVRRRPAPRLRPYIAWYSGYRQSGLAPGTHRGLPSPYLTVILTLDEPLRLAAHPDPAQPPGSYDTLVGGLHTRPALIEHRGSQSGVQLAMTPLGARALLGLPAGALASLDVDGDDLFGPWGRLTRERLLAAPDWPARFRDLDAALLARVDAAGALPADVGYAWAVLLDTGGAVAIGDLAREIGWSPRHFADRFRAEIGLSPKAAARVVRFDLARRALLGGTPGGDGLPRLSRLATAFGYYDQAHLAREFRELAGEPPSRWLAGELRNVQADPAGAGRGSAP